ncbi:MAG: HEAT repeat domain-containing protein [Planctomycetota bacterium]
MRTAVSLVVGGLLMWIGDPLEETLNTFKDQYRKHRGDTNLRIADVRDVATEITYARKAKPEGLGYDEARMARLELLVVQAFGDPIEDPDYRVREVVVETFALLKNNDAANYLINTYIVPPKNSPKPPRKAAVATAIAALGRMGARHLVQQILTLLTTDKDFDIRRSCLQALGNLHAKDAVPAIVPFVDADEAPLKAAAIDALAAIGAGEGAVPALVKALEAPDWQVRSSAINALGMFRDKSAVGPLIGRMEKEDGRLRDDAHLALMKVTGEEFAPDVMQWKAWWATVGARWKVPTPKEIEERKKTRSGTYVGKVATQSEFMNVRTQSKRIVFVIDQSGSMEDLVADRAAFKLQDRDYKSFQKMEIVKEELERTLNQLGPEVRFNVISFATEVYRWKESLVPATELNKASAVEYVHKLKPIGGSSQSFRAKAGLTASAGLDKGKTNTYLALITGLDAKPASWEATHARSGSGLEREFGSPIDTVFFLSDGEPTVGEFVQTDDIRAEVKRVNDLRKVVIHCIAIGNFQKSFMEALAKDNGGLFVDLSPNPTSGAPQPGTSSGG